VGIISEVVVQGVDRFNVEQDVKTKSVSYVEKNLDQLLEKNEHLSLYLFPFAKRCRVNTWNNAKLKKKTRFGKVRDFARISADAMLAAWVGNLFAYTGLLRLVSPLYGIESRSNLVLESNEIFNRSIYHLHQELEFSIPYEDTFEVLTRFIRLYEERVPRGNAVYDPGGTVHAGARPDPDRSGSRTPLHLDRPSLQRLTRFRGVLRGRRSTDQRDRSSTPPGKVLRELRERRHGEVARGPLRAVPGSCGFTRSRPQVRQLVHPACFRAWRRRDESSTLSWEMRKETSSWGTVYASSNV